MVGKKNSYFWSQLKRVSVIGVKTRTWFCNQNAFIWIAAKCIIAIRGLDGTNERWCLIGGLRGTLEAPVAAPCVPRLTPTMRLAYP